MEREIEKIELEQVVPDTESDSPNLIRRDMNLVGHVNVSVSVKVGEANLSIDRLFSMKSGDIVKLNETVDSPVTLTIDGKPVARGFLVAVEDNFGIQITEISK